MKELVSRVLISQGRELAYLCCVCVCVCARVRVCVIGTVIPLSDTKFQSISQQVK